MSGWIRRVGITSASTCGRPGRLIGSSCSTSKARLMTRARLPKGKQVFANEGQYPREPHPTSAEARPRPTSRGVELGPTAGRYPPVRKRLPKRSRRRAMQPTVGAAGPPADPVRRRAPEGRRWAHDARGGAAGGQPAGVAGRERGRGGRPLITRRVAPPPVRPPQPAGRRGFGHLDASAPRPCRNAGER